MFVGKTLLTLEVTVLRSQPISLQTTVAVASAMQVALTIYSGVACIRLSDKCWRRATPLGSQTQGLFGCRRFHRYRWLPESPPQPFPAMEKNAIKRDSRLHTIGQLRAQRVLGQTFQIINKSTYLKGFCMKTTINTGLSAC